MFGVESDAEENCRDRGEDQKLQHGNLRDLRPEANNERRRTADDQQATDDLAPTNVALFHERVEHFAERSAGWTWRRRWRRRRYRRRRDFLRRSLAFDLSRPGPRRLNDRWLDDRWLDAGTLSW